MARTLVSLAQGYLVLDGLKLQEGAANRPRGKRRSRVRQHKRRCRLPQRALCTTTWGAVFMGRRLPLDIHIPQPQTPRSQLPVSGEERQWNGNGMMLRTRNLPVPDYSPGQRQLLSQRERGSWLADAWFSTTSFRVFDSVSLRKKKEGV